VSRSSATLTELIVHIPTGATVIAVTDDGTDPRHAPARELAARAAVRVGGTVLFCVAPAHDTYPARSRPRLFFPPVDASPFGRPHTGTRSRDLLLAEARDVAAPGLTVGVWLPSRHGPAGVAEAAEATGATLVLVAARAHRPAVLDRTLEYLATRVPAPVVAVAADGSWTPVSDLGEPVDAWWPSPVHRAGERTLAGAM
jgi:hypothetical protein